MGRQNGAWYAQGEVREPGIIPGTQDRFSGGVNISGGKSSINGQYGMYDRTGNLRLGGTNAVLSGRGYSQTADAGVENLRYSNSLGANFAGVNSRVQASAEIGGVEVSGGFDFP